MGKYLSKLNINQDIIEDEQLIKTLSGGEKIKIQLVKIMMMEPDILLLDEPTNDLDIETLEWLEQFINETNIPIIFVSHDETLLERTANCIIHLEQIKNKTEPRHIIVKTNYADYVEERNRKIMKQNQVASFEYKKLLKTKEELSHQKSAVRSALINTKDAGKGEKKTKKMKNIKAQERRIMNNPITELIDTEESIFLKFNKNIVIPNGKTIVSVKFDFLNINNRVLTNEIELTVIGPEKIVIIGYNGVGKTTLIKKIYNLIKNRDDIKVGYMPQDYNDILNQTERCINYLKHDSVTIDETTIRAYMGSMNFTRDEMNSYIKDLSGGQKSKLIILKLILQECNVLLLDEPTRNLSPLSNPVIRKILSDYQGTIISVSHDRKYIADVATKVYELTNKGLILKK